MVRARMAMVVDEYQDAQVDTQVYVSGVRSKAPAARQLCAALAGVGVAAFMRSEAEAAAPRDWLDSSLYAIHTCKVSDRSRAERCRPYDASRPTMSVRRQT